MVKYFNNILIKFLIILNNFNLYNRFLFYIFFLLF